MSVFPASRFSVIDIIAPLTSLNTEFGGKKDVFRTADGLWNIVMWVHVHMQPVCDRVCISKITSRFLCVCIIPAHPWQAENTLIFPTLIVKGEVERIERVCVIRCVEEEGEGKIYSTSWIIKSKKNPKNRGMINLSSRTERGRVMKGEAVKWSLCPPSQGLSD